MSGEREVSHTILLVLNYNNAGTYFYFKVLISAILMYSDGYLMEPGWFQKLQNITPLLFSSHHALVTTHVLKVFAKPNSINYIFSLSIIVKDPSPYVCLFAYTTGLSEKTYKCQSWQGQPAHNSPKQILD